MDEDGNFLSLRDLHNIHILQTNFFFYHTLCVAIKKAFKYCTFNKIPQPLIPDAISFVIKRIKGCPHIYAAISNRRKTECKSFLKWKCIFDLNDKSRESNCSLGFQCTIDVGLRWFQCQVVHRILFTNDLLFKLNLVPIKKCTFCNDQIETVVHLYCECRHVNNMWDRLEDWILTETGERLKFSPQNNIFGYTGKSNLALNCILIIMRKTIYYCII